MTYYIDKSEFEGLRMCIELIGFKPKDGIIIADDRWFKTLTETYKSDNGYSIIHGCKIVFKPGVWELSNFTKPIIPLYL